MDATLRGNMLAQLNVSLCLEIHELVIKEYGWSFADRRSVWLPWPQLDREVVRRELTRFHDEIWGSLERTPQHEERKHADVDLQIDDIWGRAIAHVAEQSSAVPYADWIDLAEEMA